MGRVFDRGGGVNPYHPVFRRPDWAEHPSERIPGFPADTPSLSLTFGDNVEANLAADAATWSSYKLGVVHWVPGTNLLLLTTRTPEGSADWPSSRSGYQLPGPGRRSHTLATGAAISRACPDCYLLVVQDIKSGDGGAVQWIAERLPWVDVVQSTQFPGGDYETHDEASKALHESGRLFFGPSGNWVVTSLDPAAGNFASINLPPWVVTVGAALETFPETGARCDAVFVEGGKPTEMVGDFLQRLPGNVGLDDEFSWTGTSFSTPQVAARFAKALIGVRTRLGDGRAASALWAGVPLPGTVLEDGELTHEELRSVVSRSARYFLPADYGETCAINHAFGVARPDGSGSPGPPLPASLTPWVEMGWGFVGDAEVDRAVAVILGEMALPAKPPEAEDYMARFFAVRSQLFPDE